MPMHEWQISGCGEGSVGHDGGSAHLHGFTCLGWPSDTGVNYDRKLDLVDEDLDEVFGSQSFVGTYR